MSTSDLYIGMPVSGRGILPGTVIREVLNESDIRLSSNHAYDGSWAPITFTPQTGFEKLGVGAASLTGINTYTGATYIANGRLRIGNLRSSVGRVIVLSVAVPLVKEPGMDNYQIVVGNVLRV